MRPSTVASRAIEFVKNPDGSVFVGQVWPGPSVFPDFTRAQTRLWWGTLYKDFSKMGIDGFWNDMNEPSVFNDLKTMPDRRPSYRRAGVCEAYGDALRDS